MASMFSQKQEHQRTGGDGPTAEAFASRYGPESQCSDFNGRKGGDSA